MFEVNTTNFDFTLNLAAANYQKQNLLNFTAGGWSAFHLSEKTPVVDSNLPKALG